MTEPLEAKDRNARGQGPRTQPQVFSKKEGLQKSFPGNLQFKGVARIFEWACNDVIKNLPAFHLTRILQRERASTNVVEKCKYVTLETF